jgi:hypothetical protein
MASIVSFRAGNVGRLESGKVARGLETFGVVYISASTRWRQAS